MDEETRTAHEVVVTAREPIADGVLSLRLERGDGGRLPDWAPGAHIDLQLDNDLVRQYSLCGDRWDPYGYEVAVLREPDGRGGSAYVHEHLAVGDTVGVGGPRNNFHLAPATEYLFVAGGIGITPILPMVQAAERLGTPWRLLYGGRTGLSMAFTDRLAGFGDRVTLAPQDTCGLLDLDAAVAGLAPGGKVYCCGPAPLLAAIERATAHLPVGALRTERFVAEELPPPRRDAPFEIVLARSGRCLTVTPARSVLDVLAEHGVHLLSSCRQGLCGTCETGVVAGVPDHRDSLLDDAERRRGDCMFVCVSRACSDRLVLDL